MIKNTLAPYTIRVYHIEKICQEQGFFLLFFCVSILKMKQLLKNISFSKGSSTVSAVFIIIILVVLLVGGVLIYQVMTDGLVNDVWLKSWQYRRVVFLENPSQDDILNYKLLLRLNTSELINQGKLASDCRDIRVTDPDSEKFLPYWLEGECNSEEAKLWVRVPYLSPGVKKRIHLYYGNDNAVEGDVVENLPQNFVITRAKGTKDSITSNQSWCARGSDKIIYCVSPFGEPGGIYLFSSKNSGRDWEEERISQESSSRQDYPALAIDSVNGLHFIWQEKGELYYRQKTSAGWQEIKKIASSGQNASLTVDTYNNVHIAYADNKGDIYHYRNPFSFQPETEVVGNGVGNPDIVAGSKEDIYLAYNLTEGEIGYRQKTGADWSDMETIKGDYPSLAIDSKKVVHLVYQTGEGVAYRSRTGFGWGEEEIVAEKGDRPSLGLDQEDAIYISYGQKSDSSIYYRQKISTGWKPASKIIDGGANPNLIWSRQPNDSSIYYNIPRQGFSLIYLSATTESLKFYTDTYLIYQMFGFELPVSIEEETNIEDYSS